MNVDFSAVLLALVAVSGAIWAMDSVFFAPRRAVSEGASGDAHDDLPVLVDYARSFFPIFLIVLVLRSFLVEPFRIPSGSMMPTLLVGDFILVNKYTYGIRLPVINQKIIELGAPERGDVVVFRYPRDPSIPYIKRVVGVPGDHIAYRDKYLYVNGERVEQEQLGSYVGVGRGADSTGDSLRIEHLPGAPHEILLKTKPGYDRETVVPEGNYYVLGDNRDNSQDSRIWGFVPDENLVGKAFFIWMNWDTKNGGVEFSRIGDSIK